MVTPLAGTRRAEAVVAFPPIEIWQAFTRPDLLQYWVAEAAEVELKVGGVYNLCDPTGLELRSRIERLVEGRRLVLRPVARGDDAQIEVDLVKLAGAETRVSVGHPDLEQLEPWMDALENLRSVWEQGIDLREARKGVLGVGLSEIAPTDRPVAGVPEGHGVRLTGILAGGPAQAGGLERGDVIVSFAGVAIHKERDLVRRIQGTTPGTAVRLEAVRGGERKSFGVTIGRRSARSEPPPSREDLVARVRETATLAGVKLAKAVEGLDPERAYVPEAPAKWSVVQVLAHLSVVERLYQCWIDEAARDIRPTVDEGDATSAWKLGAVLASRPTLGELLDRLRRDQAESVALLERIPSEVIHFKPRWARVARVALEYNAHSDDHLDQIARIRTTIGA